MENKFTASEIRLKQEEIKTELLILQERQSRDVMIHFSSSEFDPKYLPETLGDYKLGAVISKPDTVTLNTIYCACYSRSETE